MTQRDRFVQAALGEVGKPYSAHRDCSGFTAWAARQAGFLLPEGSVAQYSQGHGVPVRDLQAGDLVFWDTFGPSPGHVALAINPSQVVHALNESRGIIISPIHADMGGPMVGVRRLDFAEDTEQPKHPKGGGGSTAVADSVTPRSAFRDLGNTDAESFCTALSRSVTSTPSPLHDECLDIYTVLKPHNLTRLAAAMAWIERSNESNPADLAYYGRNLHNAWAVKNSDGSWAKYPTYARAAESWSERILSSTYADLTTLGELIARYAPWSDGNNPDDYGRKAAAQINALPLVAETEPTPQPQPPPGVTMVRFAGTSVDVPLDVPLRIVLIPKGQTNQRPGIPLTPTVYVQHETGNYRPGTDAQNHLEYLQNGTEGQKLSYHFTVDEKEAIQCIPLNEVTWHGGDGAGECNYHGISCEATVQNNNQYKAKIRRNAEKLAAAAMLATHITRLQQHGTCCRNAGSPAGCHLGCPESIQKDTYWPTFEGNVRAIMAGGGVVTPPPQPVPAYPGLPAWLPGDMFEAVFPLADPAGPVTQAVVAWIATSGKVPRFVEKIDANQGRNVWVFDRVTFLSDGKRVWEEGKTA